MKRATVDRQDSGTKGGVHKHAVHLTLWRVRSFRAPKSPAKVVVPAPFEAESWFRAREHFRVVMGIDEIVLEEVPR